MQSPYPKDIKQLDLQRSVNPPISRAMYSLRLAFGAGWHRLRHDLTQELVVLLCGGVLLAVFFYIFNDFINEKVAQLSTSLQSTLLGIFCSIILFFCGWMSAAIFAREAWQEFSIHRWQKRLGEDPRFLRAFLLSYALALAVCGFVMATAILRLTPWQGTWLTRIAMFVVGAVSGIALQKWLHQREHSPLDKVFTTKETRTRGSKIAVMVRWRFLQMIRRSRVCQIYLGGALCVGIGGGIASLLGFPSIALSLFALGQGYLFSAALLWQLQDDLRVAWMERNAGVSHQEIVKVYQRLSYAAALGSALFFSVVAQVWQYSDGWKLPVLAALAPLLTPGLMFQIDARRPALQSMALFLIALFCGTAILVHGAAALLVPLIMHQATQYQANRYYRA